MSLDATLPPSHDASEAPTVEEPTESLVTLRLGTEWYALPIVKARAAVRCSQLTPLPSVPSHIAGIVNLRGEILSVTDLRRLFHLPALPVTAESRLVIVEDDGMQTALLADAVGEVIAVPVTAFEPPLTTLDAGQVEYIERVCRWKQRLIAVLRIERLLAGTASSGARGESPDQ